MSDAGIERDQDPYLWLEEVTGEAALDWVRERNAEALAELTANPAFAVLRREIQEALDADDRIPYVVRRGAYLYNFWQDAIHSKGAQVLRPDYRLALVELSRGGADAVVVREFDLAGRVFVPDGFALPEATVVYEGKPADNAVWGSRDLTEGCERDFIRRSIAFFRGETYLRRDGELTRIDVPLDTRLDVHREWLLVQPRSPWAVAGRQYPAGALLAARFDEYLAGSRELTVLFAPDERTSLADHAWTRNHLILNLLTDVRSRLVILTPGPGSWAWAELPAAPELGSTSIVDTDPDGSDEYLLVSSAFTEPATLRRGEIGGQLETVKRASALFDASEMTVRQSFAVSADGTRIPYFVVGEGRSTQPTLWYGYGGFAVSLTPSYHSIIGRGWLSRGGTYVVANLRGGGEYGPTWHASATRENRHLVYEDFVAVAKDLVARGISTVGQLGILGASNGGLLMGVMLTRYPRLFGAVVSQVPVLDMLRYHRMMADALWVVEYGDPDDEQDRSFIRPFSPYHNVHGGIPYPPVLFTTSTRDDRVHPGHARKMVARMRELGHPVRYYENTEGGHAAGTDNQQRARTWALMLQFRWDQLGSAR